MTIFLARRSYGLIPVERKQTQIRTEILKNTNHQNNIHPFLASHITLHEGNTAVTEMNPPSSLTVLTGESPVSVIVTAIQQIARTA